MDIEKLHKKCQQNLWLKDNNDDYDSEDYCFNVKIVNTIDELKDFFVHGNWAIRQGVVFNNLAFINQVNGGDEWWTVKDFNGNLIAFESVTFMVVIQKGEFEEYIDRLLKATSEQCIGLAYQLIKKEYYNQPNIAGVDFVGRYQFI